MLKKTVLVRALQLAFAASAMSAIVTPAAMAQSNASGNIYGKVAPGAASTVVFKNLDTNQTRTTAVDGSGTFSISALPIGRYSVTLMKGTTAGASATVEVLAGQGAEAVFGAEALQAVQVTGRRNRIDISSANNGATFTSRELAKLPIAQNVDAIIQLAPNTTRADPRYAGGASFAGGGASENAYYINGFPVTNPLTQLGASELPFGAIAQAQILTGGFGAEFGRSVGGVVNVTTKSGTNNWEFGAMASIEPNRLRSEQSDLKFANTGHFGGPTGTDGSVYRFRHDNSRTQTRYGTYVGGPLIQDKLFMFLSAETTRTNTDGTDAINGIRVNGAPAGGWNNTKRTVDRYFGKFDWNITDNHRLELSLIGDTPTNKTTNTGYDPKKNTHDNVVASKKVEKNIADNGADVQILKYTGNLTDDFTVQALYGRSKSKHINEFEGYDPNLFVASFAPDAMAPGINYVNKQTITSTTGNILPTGAKDKIESLRLDLEYRLGTHKIRFGLDKNKLSSNNAGESAIGGGTWTYLRNAADPMASFDLGGGISKGPGTSTSPLGKQGYYVTKNLFTDVTDAYSNQTAQYIEDGWQVTKNLLVTAGVRREGFDNQNGDHVKYIEQKNQIAPRLSAVWDMNGDASTKVFGSAGRYHLQIPTHLAVRGAGRSTFTAQAFAYTGVDANGAPTGLTQLSAPASSNNEYGQAKEPKTLSAVDLKPTYQDEITLGFERAFSPDLNFGVKGTFRKLGSTIDDFCDGRPFEKYAAANKIDTSNWSGFGCANFNPGEANSFYVDYSGSTNNGGTAKNLTLVNLSAADLGFPKAERKYRALDFFLEHPLRGGWYGKVNYTWSKSSGNTEGQTLSDVGQTDVAATQTWDYKELMIGANGPLANDRRHQVKAYGFYEVAQEWTVGGNLLLAAGRPHSCVGRFLFDGTTPNYSNGPHYCGGLTVATNVLTPRGALGNLPWDKRLDLNLVYRPNIVKGLSLKMDIFNVFNEQTTQAVEERWNNGNNLRNTFERVISTTDPRSVKLTAEYNHKF
ncbi:TonB-dependent receptor [Pseudoduganella aquatica]|uniref:TonB-dependent receptor n=1 Tax=Pseudoduganella aquatica TaxID=2660641 RepID=UPI001E4A97DF|nr:TonB-dependent receptor plug domain-containing protein [Pseudoduganella aquatica]